MDQTPFTNMANNFGTAFGTGTQTAITSMLAAVATPRLVDRRNELAAIIRDFELEIL